MKAKHLFRNQKWKNLFLANHPREHTTASSSGTKKIIPDAPQKSRKKRTEKKYICKKVIVMSWENMKHETPVSQKASKGT
jgi:hypothetical protein